MRAHVCIMRLPVFYNVIGMLLIVAYMVLTKHRVVAFDITNVPTSINRINCSVYMSRAGVLPENSMSYVHTIRIPWPNITFTPLERQSSNTIQARLLQCVSHNTMIDDMNAIFTDRIRILRESLLLSRAMIPSLGNVDRHPTKQRYRRDASKSLGSDFCKMMYNSASDNSILGTLGKVTNALMGAPSTADIITVDGRHHHRRRQTSSPSTADIITVDGRYHHECRTRVRNGRVE